MSLDKWLSDEPPKDPYKDVAGKPLGDRKLVDVHPHWKPDLCALGRYRKILKPSEEVKLSVNNWQFYELFEDDEILDCEEIWNRYFKQLAIEVTPAHLKWVLNLLIRTGLVERIDSL